MWMYCIAFEMVSCYEMVSSYTLGIWPVAGSC